VIDAPLSATLAGAVLESGSGIVQKGFGSMKSLFAAALAGIVLGAAVPASAETTGFARGGQPFDNHQPSLALTQIVQDRGIYPCRDGCSAATTMGMIRTFAGDFGVGGAPTANGQILGISQNTALFSLLMTTYGGNGKSNFALPDLAGRAILGAGAGAGLSPFVLGQQSGQALTTLGVGNLPAHDHALVGGGTTGVTGSGLAFGNAQPSLAMTYMIAADGAYPSGGIDPFLGQVAAFGGNFTPGGWLPADGRLLSISQYSSLFQVIGTTYGGDGQNTFALPDLQGRLAVGAGGGLTLGETFGAETRTLTEATMPSHVHILPNGESTYIVGGNQPFDNGQPSLALNYLIALQGIFPVRDSGGVPFDTPFYGEVVAYAGDFVPAGWALAQGQLLQIAQNQALFAILGTTYGGDGVRTFALPDLRGRTIIGTDSAIQAGQVLGQRYTTLTYNQLPTHDHSLGAVAGVPEPATWAMMLAGFGLMGLSRRARRPARLA
jgi:microcystin-dependent protein